MAKPLRMMNVSTAPPAKENCTQNRPMVEASKWGTTNGNWDNPHQQKTWDSATHSAIIPRRPSSSSTLDNDGLGLRGKDVML